MTAEIGAGIVKEEADTAFKHVPCGSFLRDVQEFVTSQKVHGNDVMCLVSN